MTEPPVGDPRWFSWRALCWLMIPAVGIRRLARSGASELRVMRAFFVGFALAPVLIGLVVVVLEVWASPVPNASRPSTAAVLAGVVVCGTVSLLAPFVVNRTPDCSTDAGLAAWYRGRFFLRIAFADAAALVGFVGFTLTWDGWLYLVGLSFAALGFARLAPTQARVERDQRVLEGTGCRRSLANVLAAPVKPAGES